MVPVAGVHAGVERHSDAGRPFDEACDELAARHPGHAALIHALKRQDEMIAGEIAGTAELVARLGDDDVPLSC